jgi:hypothetical protein
MLIKMKIGISGTQYVAAPGQEIDLPNEEALRLIEADFAEAVKQTKVEKATTRSAKKSS